MITIYGIKNCDTCAKARKWLTAEGIEHRFHDFRVDGLAVETVAGWAAELGWETLLNRAGTTFRKLPEADKQDLDMEKALVLMLAQPSMIKRPVLDLGKRRIVGEPQVLAKPDNGRRSHGI